MFAARRWLVPSKQFVSLTATITFSLSSRRLPSASCDSHDRGTLAISLSPPLTHNVPSCHDALASRLTTIPGRDSHKSLASKAARKPASSIAGDTAKEAGTSLESVIGEPSVQNATASQNQDDHGDGTNTEKPVHDYLQHHTQKRADGSTHGSALTEMHHRISELEARSTEQEREIRELRTQVRQRDWLAAEDSRLRAENAHLKVELEELEQPSKQGFASPSVGYGVIPGLLGAMTGPTTFGRTSLGKVSPAIPTSTVSTAHAMEAWGPPATNPPPRSEVSQAPSAPSWGPAAATWFSSPPPNSTRFDFMDPSQFLPIARADPQGHQTPTPQNVLRHALAVSPTPHGLPTGGDGGQERPAKVPEAEAQANDTLDDSRSRPKRAESSRLKRKINNSAPAARTGKVQKTHPM